MGLVNEIQWMLGSIDLVNVDGRRICPWADDASTSNVRSSTALTPPAMDGVERFPAESTIKVRPSKPVDVRASLARLDGLKAYRDAEDVRSRAVSSYMRRMTESFSDTWIMQCARALEAAGIRTDGRKFPQKSDDPEHHWTPEVHFLLELAESVGAPDEMPNTCNDVEFEARDGWKVSIFYDCNELDYIDHLTRPDGTVINFWDWPDGTPGRGLLMAWRGVGDYARLKREVA